MSRKRRSFTREVKERPYRKLFLISTEGKTEQKYFEQLRCLVANSTIHIYCVKPDNKSAPQYVLQRLEKEIRNRDLQKNDEAWLVIDRDAWKTEDIQKLCEWTQRHKKRFVALSHPCFEYWLLLHFPGGNAAGSASACREQLNNEWPNYHKTSNCAIFNKEMICTAIEKAKRECKNNKLPINQKGTNVYQLAQNIIDETLQR